MTTVLLLLILPTLGTAALTGLWTRAHRPQPSILNMWHQHGLVRGARLRLIGRGGPYTVVNRFVVVEASASTLTVLRVLP